MGIRLLEDKVISQIAAGEVVERPASVIKELVENSLDADASQITIEIKSGGTAFIRVTDNGSGIADDQAEIAFQRHATSKISSLEDLQNISSLGFRGEALPSIAAVSEMQMLTAERGSSSGTLLCLEDSKVSSHETRARSPGTTITVQNLFRRVPARLKFLKSAIAEGSRISDTVSQYALAYPEVKFTLIADGKTNLRTPGTGKLKDSVGAVYGPDVARNMLEIKSEEYPGQERPGAIAVSGVVSAPNISRANRDYLSFFINRRWVSNRMLGFAVEEAYHGLLMQGKHPIAVINLRLPPELIDVNVHPSKTEIKFQDERSVFSALQRAVRTTLVKSSPVPEISESKPSFQTAGIPFSPFSAVNRDLPKPDPRPSNNSQAPTPLISLPLLRLLGQIASSYIVAEGPEGLFIIDQHAAHERIQLEKIQKQRAERKIEVQGLLEPTTFEIEPKQVETMKSHLGELRDLGFDIEAFGPRTFLVRAIPCILNQEDWVSALRESMSNPTSDWAESLAVTLACHTAIRAGQVLTQIEMQELIAQLERTSLPNSCPHGRPTMIQLPLSQLEKEFGRA
jgi:DNA mismatch repair protein MutL